MLLLLGCVLSLAVGPSSLASSEAPPIIPGSAQSATSRAPSRPGISVEQRLHSDGGGRYEEESSEVGNNICLYAHDGVCDEPGSPDCAKTVCLCPTGTDCTDCGYTCDGATWKGQYQREGQALVSLYRETGGDNSWLWTTGWLNDSATNGAGQIGHCAWHGVICSYSSGAVVALHLSNGLRGTVPEKLAALIHLRELRLNTNRISGSVPRELSSLTQLTQLQLGTNAFSGTVSEQLSSLTGLDGLTLQWNAISGTIPLQMLELNKLKKLYLNSCALSGTLPEQLSVLVQLEYVTMDSNAISGTIPAQMSAFAQLESLMLNSNAISGTIPPKLSSLVLLLALQLNSNRISGTFPSQLSSLSRLTGLYLNSNPISGSFPLSLKNCKDLQQLWWFNSSVSGSIPHQISGLTLLDSLFLQSNFISGTLPPMDVLPFLTSVAAFGNRLGGHITLPSQTFLQSVLLHNNRFSCEIIVNSTSQSSNLQTRSLVLPGEAAHPKSFMLTSVPTGNAISEPLPRWLPMRAVQFLAVPSSWRAWQLELAEVGIGVAAVGVIAGVVTRGRVDKYFWFALGQPVEHLLAVCAKVLAGWSVLALSLLLPIYATGANYFECGEPFLRSTIAYLDSPSMEWASAIAACGFGSVAAWGIGVVRSQSIIHTPEDLSGSYTAKQTAIMCTCWLVIVIVFSVPSVLYVASTSIPADDNTLGLNRTRLWLFHNCGGIMLFMITSFVIPLLANTLTKLMNQAKPNRSAALHLIMSARLTIALLAPFLAVFVLNQDCHGQWLRVWRPCTANTQHFNVYNCNATAIIGADVCSFGVTQTLVVKHDEVCSPAYQSARCPRAVVGTLGTLIFQKQLFAAFLGPPIALLLLTPQVQSALTWFVRNVFRQPEYEATTSIDHKLVIINLLFDYPLVLGVCVPVLVPLSCLCMVQSMAVLHLAPSLGIKFSDMARPSTAYMWFSGCLGLALNGWVFVACEFSGVYLVAIVAPLMAVCTGWCNDRWLRKTPAQSGEIQLGSFVMLTTPLIVGADSNECSITSDGE